MTRRRAWPRLGLGLASIAPTLLMIGACGDTPSRSSDGTMAPSDASVDRERLAEPLRPDASCEVVIETPELLPADHVPEGTILTYNSNPPSSGPHYPIWANFQEYEAPVDWPYLVHSLEHGAVLLLYKPPCDAMEIAGDASTDGSVDEDADVDGSTNAGEDAGTSTSCAPVVEALRAIRDALPADPLCSTSTRVRIIIAPAPDLDVPVAASAWGWTYKAACVDAPTLGDFVRAHYAEGPENICAPGRTF